MCVPVAICRYKADSPETKYLKERQARVRGPDHHDPGVDGDLGLQGQLPADEAESKRSLRALQRGARQMYDETHTHTH